MITHKIVGLLLSCATVVMIQPGDMHHTSQFQFCSALMAACNSYIATINRLQTTEKVPTLPGASTDDLLITSLRKTALQFQDLRLRQDLLTGFTFNRNNGTNKAEHYALQNMFTDIQKRLQEIADKEESIAIHGWEIAMIHSPKKLAQELRNDLAAVAACNGQFASVLNAAITQIIDPYLAACASISH